MKMNKYLLSLFILVLYASCSEIKNVDSNDWMRYEWIVEIFGDNIEVDKATHNLDTGEYKFVFLVHQSRDSVITIFDERAVDSGWSVRIMNDLSRVYYREKDMEASPAGSGCITIHPQIDSNKFKFHYSPILNC